MPICRCAGSGLRCRTRATDATFPHALLVALSCCANDLAGARVDQRTGTSSSGSRRTRSNAAATSAGFADHGPWLRVHVVYSYALLFAATVILGFELSSSTALPQSARRGDRSASGDRRIEHPVVVGLVSAARLRSDDTRLRAVCIADERQRAALRTARSHAGHSQPRRGAIARWRRRGAGRRRPHHRSEFRRGGDLWHHDRVVAESGRRRTSSTHRCLPGLLVGLFFERRNQRRQPLVSRTRNAAFERHRTSAGNGAGVSRHHRDSRRSNRRWSASRTPIS